MAEEKKENLSGENNSEKSKVKPVTEEPKDIFSKYESETSKKAEISPAEKDSVYGKILSKVKKQPAKQVGSDDEIQSDAEAASKKSDAESQIQHLTDLALNKGVVHAVKVARHLEDNYVLDMFHDKLLADEFHKALVEKGLV